MDAGPQATLLEPKVLRQELVGVRDRFLLEVVSEREVPEHLEERQVMAVMPDEVDVDRPKDLLTRRGARMGRPALTQEVGLELHHTGAGEQQRGIAERNQGGAWQHLVIPLREEVEETLADLGACHGVRRAIRRSLGEF